MKRIKRIPQGARVAFEGISRETSPGVRGSSRDGSAGTMGLWVVAALGVGLLIGGIWGGGPHVTQAQNPEARVPVQAELAQQLSQTYRQIAQVTFPGIVAIETQGKAVSLGTRQLMPDDLFGGDPRLEQFFKNNPELRRFFGEQGKSPQRPSPRRQVPRGQGSGFVIDREGHILTNNQVVSGAEVVTVRLYDDREFVAEIVGVDPRSDVAVIKIEAPNLQPVPLGDSDQVDVGDIVLAFGSPFGLEKTMTQGIIGAKSRGPGINEREDYLQTDAAINPGNSGGPLVNLKGEVIGINTAISSRSGGYEGVGFAIPINMARWAADQIVATGQVKRAYIGVMIQPITNGLAEQLGVGVNQGAIVTQVVPNSPAEKAGLQPGDVIRELDGNTVGGTRQLQGIVEKLKIGKNYPLLIQRDGKEVRLKIAMAEMPESLTVGSQLTPSEASPSAPEEVTDNQLGLQVQELTKDLAEQLGYGTQIQGVVISSVQSESLAEEHGLVEGEVIERVNQTRITNVETFQSAMKSADVEKGILLLVRRGDATRFVAVKKR